MYLGLDDKHALVLGASQGLGLASAQALLNEGARVTLSGRSPERLEAARAALPTEQQARCFLAVADLAHPDAAGLIAAQARASGGAIDILVNNTGGPPPGTPSSITTEAMATHFASMVQPVVALTLDLIVSMRERGWGRILTIASSGVVQPIPHLPMSNALRSTLVGFMKSLAGEVAGDGVTVNMVLPGRIATGRTASIDAGQAQKSGTPVEDIAKASTATIPAGRYGTPEEFAAVVAFLASTQASYVTGSMMRVDGGAIRSI
ncbi:3-oxoacyl-[acyl-carrier protein] reductase [Devosia sp. YR412]|uniref:SDR family oxidoreductase n=1 Tax=Devosia sp. YR412 TaxID=1881030 RepID=UPI0008D11DF8|nr:SDR family oxidoreductase [Devosia sp. YR412]SEP79317.1 3-oxoacyl-[acyl-carrier protein] reductase [Devosia sp. YR412]